MYVYTDAYICILTLPFILTYIFYLHLLFTLFDNFSYGHMISRHKQIKNEEKNNCKMNGTQFP